MNGDDVKRASAVAGIGAFVLTVLLLLAFAEPGRALLAALLSGLAVGLGVGLAGSVALRSRPVVRPAPRGSALGGAPAAPSLMNSRERLAHDCRSLCSFVCAILSNASLVSPAAFSTSLRMPAFF